MSERYIREHFADIRNYANIIETRLHDEACTMETVLQENKRYLSLAVRHHADYILIDGDYPAHLHL